MRIKVIVKTPKNQAAKCVNTQKTQLLGFKRTREVKEQKVVSHNQFYWILDAKSPEDLKDITLKCSKAEVIIKKFYRTLIKVINRGNKLAKKFKLGASWVKVWVKKRLDKISQDSQDLKDYIDNMSAEDTEDALKIDDIDDILDLINNTIIKIRLID